jgi:3-oxoacyl-[acyl-carrier-protein] synthase II
MESKRRVVVTGLGVVSPLGCDVAKFWERIKAGQSGIRAITRFDTTGFDTTIAGEVVEFDVDSFIEKKEQRRMDPYTHYAIAASKLAFKDSGLDMNHEDPTRAGVIIGSGVGGLQTLQTQHAVFLEKGPSRLSPFMIPQMISNMASGMAGIALGFKGPNWGVVSACASAAHSLGDALKSIRDGEADIVASGGSEAAVCQLGVAGFSVMKAMSTRNSDPTKASRPFDLNRDGFVMGEGSAILILEELEHAKKRGAHIYCEILSIGATCDAHHMTAPADDGEGAARAMTIALKNAGLRPEQVDYINAHGTSTPLNDRCETAAIKTVFGDHARKLMISSTKSMTGHLLGAAGAIESAVCALALQDGIVPPTINYETPDPACDLDYVPNQARQKPVKVVLNNALGFGGHNASLAFRKFE